MAHQTGANSTTRPYTAPVYLTYKECIGDLYSQGFRAFFKGNACRLAGYSLKSGQRMLLATSGLYRENIQRTEISPSFRRLLLFGILCASDLAAYPLMVAESRFTLGHLKREFRGFSFGGMFEQLRYIDGGRTNFSRGIMGVFALNALQAGFLDASLMEPVSLDPFHLSFGAFVLGYPLVTAMRRLQCQSGDVGMIPERYSNVRHALRLIYSEEGLKGLFRGFWANAAGLTVLMALNGSLAARNASQGRPL